MREKTTVNEQVNLFETAMKARALAKSTKRTYSSVVRKFLRHFRTHPEDINRHQITAWIAQHKAGATKAQVRGALLNYYDYVIGQKEKFDHVPIPKQEQKLPVIMSRQECLQRIDAIQNLKHKAIVSVFYDSGIRRAELLNLQLQDVDHMRETIHVHRGKGAKDRIIPVSAQLLVLLRQYQRQYNPKKYLFEGWKRKQYSAQSVLKVCRNHMGVNPHNLRHCHATHLLEAGVPMPEVSRRLGHKKTQTTEIYNHITTTTTSITLLAAA